MFHTPAILKEGVGQWLSMAKKICEFFQPAQQSPTAGAPALKNSRKGLTLQRGFNAAPAANNLVNEPYEPIELQRLDHV
jgi:hypothetical protein